MTANNTVDTTATTVKADVETTPNVDSTADTETPEVKPETSEVKEEADAKPAESQGNTDAPKADSKPAPAEVKADRKQSEAQRKDNQHKLEAAIDAHGQAREDHNGYADLGFVYAGQAPIANSIGAEFGIVTRDEKDGTVQRSGFGIYFRSDHLWNKKYDSSNIQLV